MKTQFQDGETVHFLRGEDGNWYLTTQEEYDRVGEQTSFGSATIDHVDLETKTIWFTTPVPEIMRPE